MAATRESFFLAPILLWCYLSIGLCRTGSTNTLRQGETLTDWKDLTSANNNFTLKFFSPGNSKVRYLGIFDNMGIFDSRILNMIGLNPEDPVPPVWVANRDVPIPDASGNLSIDADGKFQISHAGGTLVVISDAAAVATNASATLLDSGNLVLWDSNGSILWQSFDYPTDTLLPGMRIGINMKTGHQWRLASWTSNDVPSPGSFTLELGDYLNGSDHTSQLVIMWRGNVSWMSGPLLNGRFQNTTDYTYSHSYDIGFNYTSNEAEKYFTYYAKENWRRAERGYLITLTGKGYLLSTPPFISFMASRCDPYYNMRYWGTGCVQQASPKCRTPNHYFEHRQGDIYGTESYKYDESHNLSAIDCQQMCWDNCTCAAYASLNLNGTGCEFFNSLNGYYASDGITPARGIYVLRLEKGHRWRIWVIVGTGSFIILLLCLCCSLVRRKIRMRRQAKTAQKMIIDESGSNTIIAPSAIYRKGSNEKKGKKMSSELQLFNFQTISAATEKFAITNKLGQGGFGPVYKGRMVDGQEIAVKRLSTSSGQGLVEFKNEIKLIAKLQHNNLVRLLGCCIQGEEKLLIYEYMPNKSLDFFLFDPMKKDLLSWKKRSIIIEGIAQGLLYLHKYSRLRVIHRDLKASNVLLDNNLIPKISDFGMAKIFGINESEANTNRVVGTYGYMPPEYAMKGIVSEKTDVFSFGVLLLEIMSSKKNNSSYDLEHPINLTGLAWKMWKEGRALELIGGALADVGDHNEVMRYINVGLLCVQDNPMDRPCMSDVVSMITNKLMQLPSPERPAFFIEKREAEAMPKDKPENKSINNLTVSVLEAR